MASTVLSVPEIHCEHCRSAIEGAVSPLEGIDEVEVDISSATVRLEHDDDLAPGTLAGVVDAIEDQGYDVPEQDALAGVR